MDLQNSFALDVTQQWKLLLHVCLYSLSELEKASPTSIILDRMDFTASGAYACEVALETPLYSKVSKVHEITVIMPQKHAPKIKIKNRRIWSRDTLEAVCHSAPAHPAPHLTWFINNTKVDERFTTPHGISKARHHHGVTLATSNCSLHYPLGLLRLLPNQTLELSCVATIPSYVTISEDFADVQKNTVIVNVVRREPTPTQLPVKIVHLEETDSSVKQHRAIFVLLLFTKVVLCTRRLREDARYAVPFPGRSRRVFKHAAAYVHCPDDKTSLLLQREISTFALVHRSNSQIDSVRSHGSLHFGLLRDKQMGEPSESGWSTSQRDIRNPRGVTEWVIGTLAHWSEVISGK
ncbi:hypothetical protein EVAR_98490_1 [Eumeta japonica]|uniref:Ig-like domain-containing protein n=1 Tax=Eumeta variegata TaxID=151549 RepID=A0A4C1YH37_EUMVA|nr:hypothetical protein EVAR_98490_1 [Eumeta japonica]